MKHLAAPNGASILAEAQAALRAAQVQTAEARDEAREPAGNPPVTLRDLPAVQGIQGIPDEFDLPPQAHRPAFTATAFLEAPNPYPQHMPQKFGDVPSQLRETQQINTFEIKKLNLAATIEALERAVMSQEAMPSPDAAFAVAALSEQVMKLTRELEKSQDPAKIYRRVVDEILAKLVEHMIYTICSEMKRLKQDSHQLLSADREGPMSKAIDETTLRVGPILSDVLEIAKKRMLKIFDLKEVKDHSPDHMETPP